MFGAGAPSGDGSQTNLGVSQNGAPFWYGWFKVRLFLRAGLVGFSWFRAGLERVQS